MPSLLSKWAAAALTSAPLARRATFSSALPKWSSSGAPTRRRQCQQFGAADVPQPQRLYQEFVNLDCNPDRVNGQIDDGPSSFLVLSSGTRHRTPDALWENPRSMR
jgi:hypothetical protein